MIRRSVGSAQWRFGNQRVQEVPPARQPGRSCRRLRHRRRVRRTDPGLVRDFITPLIAAIGGNPDFASLSFTVNHSTFHYGDFINLLLAFLIVAAVVYFLVVVPFSRLLERYKPAPDEPTPVQDCPHCLSSIPQSATVCAFCTRDVAPGLPLPDGRHGVVTPTS